MQLYIARPAGNNLIYLPESIKTKYGYRRVLSPEIVSRQPHFEIQFVYENKRDDEYWQGMFEQRLRNPQNNSVIGSALLGFYRSVKIRSLPTKQRKLYQTEQKEHKDLIDRILSFGGFVSVEPIDEKDVEKRPEKTVKELEEILAAIDCFHKCNALYKRFFSTGNWVGASEKVKRVVEPLC